MITGTMATITGSRLTAKERHALRSLRAMYEAQEHIFTAQELARLRFLRWLVLSRRWNHVMDRPERTHGMPPHVLLQSLPASYGSLTVAL